MTAKPTDRTRRALLAGAATAVTSPAWLTAAFAAEPPERQLELFATWHAARRSGKSVLAVVVPEEDIGGRGRAVGGVLGEADNELLNLLADYVPVCATALDLHLLGVVVEADAWFVVIDASAVPARIVPIGGPGLPQVDLGADIDLATSLLRRALKDLAPARPRTGRAERQIRVGQARDTWISSRLPGSYWAYAGGCGGYIEGDVDDRSLGISCGMGSVPERAARFLLFLDASGLPFDRW